jgi:hypothetical protein
MRLLVASLLVILVVVAIFCLTNKRDHYSGDLPPEPAACRWMAEEMYEGGADPQLIRNARDICSNYHGLCGRASGGAQVLGIYDNFGNNWEAATDIFAQEMDVVGKDKNQCAALLPCRPHHSKCPSFLQCVSETCQ